MIWQEMTRSLSNEMKLVRGILVDLATDRLVKKIGRIKFIGSSSYQLNLAVLSSSRGGGIPVELRM